MEVIYATLFVSALLFVCMIVLNIPATVGEGLVSIKEVEDDHQ